MSHVQLSCAGAHPSKLPVIAVSACNFVDKVTLEAHGSHREKTKSSMHVKSSEGNGITAMVERPVKASTTHMQAAAGRLGSRASTAGAITVAGRIQDWSTYP